MPIGLILTTPAGIQPHTPLVAAACAAARSCIRRRGFTIRESWSATVTLRRRAAALATGRPLPPTQAPIEWLAAASSAWIAAEHIAGAVGWSQAGLLPPRGLRLALGIWPTGRRQAASRVPAHWSTPDPRGT